MGTGISDGRDDGRDDRLNLLADVTRAFVEEADDLDRLFAIVARRISEAMGDTCILLLLNSARDQRVPVGVHDPDPRLLELAREVAAAPYSLAAHPTSRRVVETGEPIVAPRIDPSKIDTTPRFAAFFKAIDIGMLIPMRARQFFEATPVPMFAFDAETHGILGHAWKFTGRRARAEIVRGEQVVDGVRVVFVRDNGAGFDPEYATRLFTLPGAGS